MFDDCIIMAGGSGTRLWPASNSQRPKQFLPVSRGGSHTGDSLGGHTFFHAALERAVALIDRDRDGRVIIIAGERHVPFIIEACGLLHEALGDRLVLIPEPEAKNTAAAIALGITYVQRVSHGERTILVLTSDHSIQPLEVFKVNAIAAAAFVRQEQLVVFGIPPRSPATGYGYIETAERLSLPEDVGARAFRVASFREKPDRAAAEQFVAAGNFYWNSGMFAFSSGFMRLEFKRHAPDVIAPFTRLPVPEESAYKHTQGVRILTQWPGLPAVYAQVQAISFDYAIGEQCTQTVMVAADFAWLDVGSWDEYERLVGDTGSEVYQSGGNPCFVDADIPVALCGVEDLIVVVRSGNDGAPPSVLIAKRGETQRVKEIVEKIRAAGRTELL
ncbi:MAG: mannose-1-phosphate guanylyltransferase [Treponema sp.]|jgi:mannose-1-phosphate guanylyltransferase/mannose-1-phosphate guanylyltransferase/mannose-6-phosphate isomerase|nr:mannose-1-phosphate guanylyltransferase [Treponema sp.]